MAMHYTGALLGRRARIEFPKSVVDVDYTVRGDINWKVTCKESDSVTRGTERAAYLMISDTLHFLNWKEKTGFSVSQVIDTEAGTVRAFWSYAESESFRRASMFVDGRFEFA